jgi:hypothetical protein
MRPGVDDGRSVETLTDEALDGDRSVFPVGDGLPLGNLTDQPLATLREGDHRRRRASTLAVGENKNLTVNGYSNARVRGS